MTAITLVADKVRPINPESAEIIPSIAGATLTRGLAGYIIAASGKIGIADANAAGLQQARGVVLTPSADGQAVELLKKGKCAGFDVSALDYDAPVYLSDTAGAFDTAAGTLSVICGRVVPMSDNDRTKVIYFDFDWLRTWA
jgi:hypothetical protein